MDPLTRGEYPVRMRKLVGDRLPKFTQQQSEILKGSFDFIGVNYYTARFTHSIPISNNIVNKSYDADQLLNQTGKHPVSTKWNVLYCRYTFFCATCN
jgi:beta-glucosidase